MESFKHFRRLRHVNDDDGETQARRNSLTVEHFFYLTRQEKKGNETLTSRIVSKQVDGATHVIVIVLLALNLLKTDKNILDKGKG